MLRAELRRRGLWSAPPSYLGIYGWSTWEETDEPGNGRAGAAARWRAGSGDALEELAAGCYAFIFIDRLRSLAAHLQVKPDVEGLVLLDVRHFLHERQRQHDPLGYRVFVVAREAVRLALARGDLQVTAGDARVRNDTLLAFAEAADGNPAAGVPGAADAPAAADQAAAVAAALPGSEVRAIVQGWNDRLLPELVTAAGRAQEEVAERLSRCLPELRQHGVLAFRFKELIDPLKADVRARWAALLQVDERPPGARPRGVDAVVAGPATAWPDSDLQMRAGFSGLARSVAAAVERLDTDARTREYLAKLWSFLSRSAVQEEVSVQTAPSGGALSGGAPSDGAPSHRKLARLLGIPRNRLPELYATLGGLVREARGKERQAPRAQRP